TIHVVCRQPLAATWPLGVFRAGFGTGFSLMRGFGFSINRHADRSARQLISDPMTASPINTPKQNNGAASADGLIRRLSVGYFFVLVAVAALVVIDQAIVQPLLVRMNSFAPAINLAGRQRMLSQRLTKAALAIQVAGDDAQRQHYETELRTTLAQWT